MNEAGLRRTLPDQSSGSGHTFDTPHHQSVIDPILSKRVCFYKSGDPQFNGLRMVINNRTFKTFDALLDNLSKKVPLPFGVRNITTPRGVHGIHTLAELEDGKSYICSDSRKVKPINLALARKKLPPWYHARPVSSRRQVVQQARFLPGRGLHRQESVVMRTPRKLVVYRNGDPSVKHTVVLHKKTTPNYESILDYISELMRFHVVKLYTLDGRRVDGLPGLILSSGAVVAVGRELFRPAMYSAQKSPVSTRQHFNPSGFRRQKALNPETEGDTCLGDGAEGRDCSLPSEDNIEKSFRVNQDGSMTVEMKVRLTIKEEETVHWTTTLTRSSVADLLNATCLPEPEAEKKICSSKSNSRNLQSPAASIDTIKDKTKDNNDDDDDPPSLGNGAFSDSSLEEDDIKRHTGAASPRRIPTPGYKRFRKQQASVESIKSVTADGIEEGTMGSYSYSQQTETGTMTEQYCMVKQSTTRPVPKPRTFNSVDANKSVGKTEMLQEESSGEELTETVLHVYEQQTCQDNFHANVSAHEEEQPAVPCKKLQVIVEESLSGNEEEQEEESLHELPKSEEQTKKSRELEALIEEPEEDQVSSEEDIHDDKPKSKSPLHSSLIISDSLEKGLRFNPDDDSGNDHSSCGEHVDEEQLQVEDEQISSSNEEELSYYEKESSSEEDQATYIKKRCTQYQDVPVTTQPEKVVVELKEQCEEIITQSVAERVILLEKQAADAQKAKTTPQSFRCFSQRKATLESDEEDTPSESPTSDGALCTRSAPQSSLSFSYDSSGVITTEPEGSRVRSIREMFMAKSATDIQQRRFPSSNSSEQSGLRAETSGSGGYQSQTSSELSSGEDDSARKSITKGFVRRTIERLYGKKDTNSEEPSERPPSEPNQRRKEHSSIFSPFYVARSKAMSEMSYFNSTNALDVFSEATRCIAFNAQVGPGDSVPIDNGRWLLKENTLIRKSVSDPVGINKTFTNTSQDEGIYKDTEDNTLHSLFSTKPELEEKVKPLPRKCTYFSLPHASESEVFQDDLSTVSKSSEKGDSVTEAKDDSEDTKTWEERNGMLPSVGAADFKIKDNKVHPLIELPPDGEVVVVQPRKDQAPADVRQKASPSSTSVNWSAFNCS
ncbi:oxygen-regulated protein 1-like [Melanotaenia boesemani]|uniref:oxygen-regulated protein 1-like n=1 Tax=Melanotaenia boesemani TaxID=1250792 RepID=UPI001C04C8B5|nr:oxygen-regulated protein 1-like [Melanotaenia boesemani]